MRKLLKMFFIFMKIGFFTLGGGYAMIPLMEEEFVEKNKWIKSDEFIDIIGLAQVIPGALAVNTSIYIGYRLFGISGGIIGCLGTMIPSITTILMIAVFFKQFQNIEWIQSLFKGIRPAVVALILVSVLKLGKNLPKNTLNISWVLGTVFLITIFDVHPILIIIGSALLGYKLFKGENIDENHS